MSAQAQRNRDFRPLGRAQAVSAEAARRFTPAVAMDADGDTVVAYLRTGLAGGPSAIEFVRVSAAGAIVARGIVESDPSPTALFSPAVAMAANGDFTVAWVKEEAGPNSTEIFARIYTALGEARGNAFRVNTIRDADQSEPSVAMGVVGSFVIAWKSDDQDGGGTFGGTDIVAQRFNSSGVEIGTEIRVSRSGAENNSVRSAPAVGINEEGGFVFVWTEGSATGRVVTARFFSDDGLGDTQFPVEDNPLVSQTDSHVAVTAEGIVVTWAERNQSNSEISLRSRRFSDGALPLDTPSNVVLTLNETFSSPSNRVAASLKNEHVVVAESGSLGGLARRFRPSRGGFQFGDIYQLPNQAPPQFLPANLDVAMDVDGDFVIAWEETDSEARPQVYFERFRGSEGIDLAALIVDNKNRNRPARVGEPVTYTATIANLQPHTSLTGVFDIDSAIGAALGVEVILALPLSQPDGPVRFVPREAGRCRVLDRAVRCFLAQPLKPEELAEIRFRLRPVEEGRLTVGVSVRSDSFEDRDELLNNTDDELTRVGPILSSP